jgi:N-dimethylarginine dimethylaminohydrolase
MATISINVKDEFSQLRKVIAHDALNAIDMSMADFGTYVEAAILAGHPETGPVFRHRVIEQQAQLLNLLRFNGVAVVPPTPQAEAFCQVFTRDPCFAIKDTLFLGSLRDSYRHPEVAGLVEIGRSSPDVAALWGGGARIEGGDVFVCNQGQKVLVGMNHHTNEQGRDLLIAELARRRMAAEVVTVRHRALHLDCCFAPLPDGRALVAHDLLHPEGLHVLEHHFHLIDLDPMEATLHLAANLLWLDRRRVVSGSSARRTNAWLRAEGYDVIELDFPQLVSMWGSFRCVTCPLVRSDESLAEAAAAPNQAS